MNPVNTQEAKVALVTGGARRIGAAIVKNLHAAGYKVVIHCRHALAEANDLAEFLNKLRPDSALVFAQELTAPNAAEKIINAVSAWNGRLDLLVNNASIFIRTQVSAEDWDKLFQINVKVPFLLSLAARPLLAQQSGAIINISDTHADRPLANYSIYCQSKAALEMQTKSLAREFGPEIRVNAVAPGAIAWPEHDNSLSLELKNKIIEQTTLKRHGDPEFIARAVLALAENSFITGQVLKVDGGRGL